MGIRTNKIILLFLSLFFIISGLIILTSKPEETRSIGYIFLGSYCIGLEIFVHFGEKREKKKKERMGYDRIGCSSCDHHWLRSRSGSNVFSTLCPKCGKFIHRKIIRER